MAVLGSFKLVRLSQDAARAAAAALRTLRREIAARQRERQIILVVSYHDRGSVGCQRERLAAIQRLYEIEFEHAGTINLHAKLLSSYVRAHHIGNGRSRRLSRFGAHQTIGGGHGLYNPPRSPHAQSCGPALARGNTGSAQAAQSQMKSENAQALPM